jgi:hypothetical protein
VRVITRAALEEDGFPSRHALGESWDETCTLIRWLRGQDFVLEHLAMALGETEVHADLPERIARNGYYVRRMLHQASRVAVELHNVVTTTLQTWDLPVEADFVTHPPNDSISFELDALLAAAWTLIEEPARSSVLPLLPKRLRRDLEAVWPTRSDPAGLYWRLNCLRNRAVHHDGSFYTPNGEILREFTSKFDITRLGGKWSLPTDLIDLERNPQLEAAVEACMQDKGTTLTNEMLQRTRPPGTPRKRSKVVAPTELMPFDLATGLPSLMASVGELVDQVHHIYARAYSRRGVDLQGMSFAAFDGSSSMTAEDFFPGLTEQ